MSIYSQGICGDGAAILEDGQMMSVDSIVQHLNAYECLVSSRTEKLAAAESQLAALKEENARPKCTADAIDRSTIRQLFIANGFSIKSGNDDLKEYVYAAAEALIAKIYCGLERQKLALKEENERLKEEIELAELEELNTELRADVAKLKERDVDAIANKICEHLPEGYEIRLCMEKDAGWVELHCPDSDNGRHDFECSIYSQLLCALEVAEELSKEPANEG